MNLTELVRKARDEGVEDIMIHLVDGGGLVKVVSKTHHYQKIFAWAMADQAEFDYLTEDVDYILVKLKLAHDGSLDAFLKEHGDS